MPTKILMIVGEYVEDDEVSAPLQTMLAGATCAPSAIDEAVVDGSLVTAPAWPAHPKGTAGFFDGLGVTIRHGPE